ncbi:hypothetical protein [Azospirillum lipoferum]|uniref:Uncharacterized protein n=1 Tax=Azospirillum lipoferum (strain 4B) TaxID=862719 RepID=G7Z7Q7_AZOL4|nr:hypothetical protein [Azospirillum lipoferum]CBS87019.1 protein of unknown function; putative coiled-coil domain [Azospirillum lipoferum 4B]
MPDTHLVMPRTLSAPYAELLEAETPQTMTASDAPPNGTAAAAVAFARLLASGDHAMQPETTTDKPAANAPARDTAHPPHSLRAMLLGSSTLPALGMTIAEASQKTAELLAENDGPAPLNDEQADALAARWSALENAVIRAAAALCRAVRQMLSVTNDAEVLGVFVLSLRRHAQMLEANIKRSQSLIVGPDLSVPEAGEEAPQDTLASLYVRWVQARARYLDEGLSEEDHEAAEAALDELEDRLELEPVQHLSGAIVKLGYFLKRSNDLLDDELLPNIDESSSRPWPRLLFLIEGGADQLPANMREPFRAMVTGLRQLMQRHVKLAEEAERREEVYQLPEEISRAMQAVCTRNRAASADEEVRAPDLAQGQRDEALRRFCALKPERREAFLSFMRFLPVSSHLHSAMLDFAREHGMTWEYRQWMEDHLADIPAEQGGANDQHQDADAFADTVAAFEAEAPATLALPLEPTGRMVDAGASAAGITPEQFQAAYAAAVEALKLERAA